MNTKLKIIFIAFIAITGFFLITDHSAHIYDYSQYILFAAFIILHLFMHTGHSGHGGKKGGHH